MIDAKTARNWMPSTLRQEQLRRKRLEEISTLIEDAARNDKDSITIYLYTYEDRFIIDFLKNKGYDVEYLSGTAQQNENIIRAKYKISW